MSRSLASITDLPQFWTILLRRRERAGLRKSSRSKASEAGLPVATSRFNTRPTSVRMKPRRAVTASR